MDLTVKTVQENNGNLPETLGIGAARQWELLKTTAEALRKGKYVTDTFEEVSRACVHPNELAFVCYLVGKAHQVNEEGIPMKNCADALERGMKR